MSVYQYFKFNKERRSKQRFKQIQSVQDIVFNATEKIKINHHTKPPQYPSSARKDVDNLYKAQFIQPKFQNHHSKKGDSIMSFEEFQNEKNKSKNQKNLQNYKEKQNVKFEEDSSVQKIYVKNCSSQTEDFIQQVPIHTYYNTYDKYRQNDFYQPNYAESLKTTYRSDFCKSENPSFQNQKNLGQRSYNKWQQNVDKYSKQKERRDRDYYYEQIYYPKFL